MRANLDVNPALRLKLARALLPLAWALACAAPPALTRAEDVPNPAASAVARAWISAAVSEQANLDRGRRIIGAPTFALTGAAVAVLPFLVDGGTPAAVASFGTAASLLTAAIGTWVEPDAYASERWYTRFGHLGYAGGGAMLMLFRPPGCSLDPFEGVCSRYGRATHRFMFVLGALEAAYYVALLVIDLVLPPPDPRRFSARLGSTPDDYPLALELLQTREKYRRVVNYVALPLTAITAVGFLWVGSQAETSGGRAAGYIFGGVYAAMAIGLTLYEVLRTPDDVRLQRGEGPN
jgi:hypothetical protein